MNPTRNRAAVYRETAEQKRLNDAREKAVPWRKWGPYLSERQWGTVREDYSLDGNPWEHFTHEQAHFRTYRWGEDGLAGISDDRQQLCFAVALWNGRDPILKERLFGLNHTQGNHGEDVKEYYFYLDSTPTYSYMKYLYKYPQTAFPYTELVETNGRRSRSETEHELLDTGVFDDDRYFDVFVEYCKSDPETVLIRITVENRGPEKATLHLLPTLWFRNTWSWGRTAKPLLNAVADTSIRTVHATLGIHTLQCDGAPKLLFTENESNLARLWGQPNPTPYLKDGFHTYIIAGDHGAVNPSRTGTKAAADYRLEVPADGAEVIRLRLGGRALAQAFDERFDKMFASRLAEADDFYGRIAPHSLSEDERRVHRQALAGMLWSKQYYFYDVDCWLQEHDAHPLSAPDSSHVRNSEWFHMFSSNIVSTPDKWEYPWYASWDLAFHTLALSLVDPDFAKEQLLLTLDSSYSHPNGQMPAHEWNFSDVNPPVHAWATLFLHYIEDELGRADVHFLEQSFHGLLQNFTWWANRRDPQGRNVFSGGFLGLDNIGVFDHSVPLPLGGNLDQADGTAWMAFFCQNMLEMALLLAEYNPVYEDLACRFAEDFVWITYAMDRIGEHHDEMWDSGDGFFYNLLQLPNGRAMRLKVRSMAGLIPLCAASVFEGSSLLLRHPRFARFMTLFRDKHPEVLRHIAPADSSFVGFGGRRLFSVCDRVKIEKILRYMLDEDEFLGPHGIRSLSKYHLAHPFVFSMNGCDYTVQYLPGESSSEVSGANSNWRGSVWLPVNILLIRSLLNLYQFYGDDFKVECPTGSGIYMSLFGVANEITRRLSSIFLRDPSGKRPVHGAAKKFQEDPHWKDLILFYEYFHGDNGGGLGASHQTGWTGVIARALDLFGRVKPETALRLDRAELIAQMARGEIQR